MLEHPILCTGGIVVFRYTRYSAALAQALLAPGTSSWISYLRDCRECRKGLRLSLDTSDYNYSSFQIWQEGIARYTEYRYLELLGSYRPAWEVANLHEIVPFATYREIFFANQLDWWQIVTCDESGANSSIRLMIPIICDAQQGWGRDATEPLDINVDFCLF